MSDPETPYLAVDLSVLDRNIAGMAEHARTAGVDLRPHAKTHKCLQIAARQTQAGAVGLTVATVGEAEVFADGGFTDLFIAYPLWAHGRRGERLRAVAERTSLRVGVDSPAAAELLAASLKGAPAEVLVEVDSGQHRSGVPPARAAEVARAAERAGLEVAGVFTFPGHAYAPGAPPRAGADEAAALQQSGLGPVRSGGSTPSAQHAHPDVLTELRPGVYALNDTQATHLSATWNDVALTVSATVVSHQGDRVILDAGSKVLGADRPSWVDGFGRLIDYLHARIPELSEHHATVVAPEGGLLPELGETVRVVPNHVCATVNLADRLYPVRDRRVVDEWSIAARGRNS